MKNEIFKYEWKNKEGIKVDESHVIAKSEDSDLDKFLDKLNFGITKDNKKEDFEMRIDGLLHVGYERNPLEMIKINGVGKYNKIHIIKCYSDHIGKNIITKRAEYVRNKFVGQRIFMDVFYEPLPVENRTPKEYNYKKTYPIILDFHDGMEKHYYAVAPIIEYE